MAVYRSIRYSLKFFFKNQQYYHIDVTCISDFSCQILLSKFTLWYHMEKFDMHMASMWHQCDTQRTRLNTEHHLQKKLVTFWNLFCPLWIIDLPWKVKRWPCKHCFIRFRLWYYTKTRAVNELHYYYFLKLEKYFSLLLIPFNSKEVLKNNFNNC